MTDIIYMTLVFIAGFALGTFFFGGLWFTVKKAFTVTIPAIWFFGSFLMRVTVVMLGFYYISPGGWQPLIVSLFGFIASRAVVTYFTKSMAKKQAKRPVYNEA